LRLWIRRKGNRKNFDIDTDVILELIQKYRVAGACEWILIRFGRRFGIKSHEFPPQFRGQLLVELTRIRDKFLRNHIFVPLEVEKGGGDRIKWKTKSSK